VTGAAYRGVYGLFFLWPGVVSFWCGVPAPKWDLQFCILLALLVLVINKILALSKKKKCHNFIQKFGEITNSTIEESLISLRPQRSYNCIPNQ
jgi:hypothetical protein